MAKYIYEGLAPGYGTTPVARGAATAGAAGIEEALKALSLERARWEFEEAKKRAAERARGVGAWAVGVQPGRAPVAAAPAVDRWALGVRGAQVDAANAARDDEAARRAMYRALLAKAEHGQGFRWTPAELNRFDDLQSIQGLGRYAGKAGK